MAIACTCGNKRAYAMSARKSLTDIRERSFATEAEDMDSSLDPVVFAPLLAR